MRQPTSSPSAGSNRESAWVSVDAGIVSLTAFGQVGGVCDFVDTSGNPRSIPGYVPEPECDFGCPSACVVSDDGRHMAFHEVHESPLAEVDITVIDTATGTSTGQLAVPAQPAQWSPQSLDISGSRVLLNRRWESAYEPAWVFDLNAPEEPKREVPVAGRATFVEGPIDLPAPVHLNRGEAPGSSDEVSVRPRLSAGTFGRIVAGYPNRVTRHSLVARANSAIRPPRLCHWTLVRHWRIRWSDDDEYPSGGWSWKHSGCS